MGSTTRRTGSSGSRWTLRSFAIAGAGSVVLVAGSAPRMAMAVSGALQNPDNGHWYKFVDVSPAADWDSCRIAAASLGGYLATLTSGAEAQWVVLNLDVANKPACWIGGTDGVQEGTWAWVDAETWSDSNWAAGQPDDAGGAEDCLQMAPDGTWSDEAATHTNAGCIVEWNTDPGSSGTGSPPIAPTNLAASYAPGTGVVLTWSDNSTDETGFRIERRPSGVAAFSERIALDGNAATWTDMALYPSTTFLYRVAALNEYGLSACSNEVSITTSAAEAVPAPPGAPGALTATPRPDPAIDLTWTDNGTDETSFDVERAAGGSAFRRRTLLAPDSVSMTDDQVHPGWPYAYRVRALSLEGPSGYSNAVSVTVPATIDVAVRSGTLTRARKPRRDALKLVALCTIPVPGGALDPVGNGLEMQIGPASAPAAVSIAAHDPAWKVKSRAGKAVRAAWTSPKGAAPKLRVTVDLVAGTITLTASGADFAADRSRNVRVLVACGANCGSHAAAWSESKPGVLRFK